MTSVLLYESVTTTKKRAEVVQPLVERIISTAKKKDPLNAIRAINRVVTHVNACKKVMELLKDRYSKRSSGFTRITPLGLRHGDGARMVQLELVDSGAAGQSMKSTKSKKSTKTSSVTP